MINILAVFANFLLVLHLANRLKLSVTYVNRIYKFMFILDPPSQIPFTSLCFMVPQGMVASKYLCGCLMLNVFCLPPSASWGDKEVWNNGLLWSLPWRPEAATRWVHISWSEIQGKDPHCIPCHNYFFPHMHKMFWLFGLLAGHGGWLWVSVDTTRHPPILNCYTDVKTSTKWFGVTIALFPHFLFFC